MRLRELLTHLYVLIPVLDDEKHYWVGDDEVEKLLAPRRGLAAGAPRARADRDALPEAPARRSTRAALEQLLADEDAAVDDDAERRAARGGGASRSRSA